ncbi:MAG: ATP-binding protein [Verrucomicrobiota bacterium]
MGPQSTGKSTLAEHLSARFGEPWSREYVRRFWDEHDGVITAADLDAIGRGQLAGERTAQAAARRLVFHDTDLLTCRLWDDLLFAGHCPEWVRTEGDARARSAALYLFCDTDLPWAPDPQRVFPDDEGRAMCRRLFLGALDELGIKPVMIAGDWPARRAAAVAAVEALLKTT